MGVGADHACIYEGFITGPINLRLRFEVTYERVLRGCFLSERDISIYRTDLNADNCLASYNSTKISYLHQDSKYDKSKKQFECMESICNRVSELHNKFLHKTNSNKIEKDSIMQIRKYLKGK